ncbi:hypothetical protein HPP92_028366 [Vanilla planifolia]|uniref:Uncharacterized protein n=1 Tax=Vanilla planifolia TaxID=51239 RepID=A0A835P7N5_VANPL|nr:hypothetical protein HPP92_028366 [Vanilla planifolia]
MARGQKEPSASSRISDASYYYGIETLQLLVFGEKAKRRVCNLASADLKLRWVFMDQAV